METNSFLSKNWKNILLIVFFFVIIALVMSTTCANRKLDVTENNLKAMTDTLRTYELKNGELLYAKQGYITKIGELETFIGVKEKEIKELEKKIVKYICAFCTKKNFYKPIDKTEAMCYNIIGT